MAEDEKPDGNDYMKKCDENLNAFQTNLAKAIQAFEADNDTNGEFFALVLANEYKKLMNRMTHFVSALSSGDKKGGEDDDGKETA